MTVDKSVLCRRVTDSKLLAVICAHYIAMTHFVKTKVALCPVSDYFHVYLFIIIDTCTICSGQDQETISTVISNIVCRHRLFP